MMDENDLEEGELNSDGDEDRDELEAVDYEILPRPVKSLVPPSKSCAEVEELSAAGPGSSRTMGVDPSYQHVSRPTRPAPILEANDQDDELFDKSSSSSEDDSDDEGFGPSGRKCRRMPEPSTDFRMPIIAPPKFAVTKNDNDASLSFPVGDAAVAMDSNDVFRNQAAVFQQKRKPNSVWSTVLQEEQVSDVFGKVNVNEYDEQHVLIDRGPETFSVKYKAPRIPIPQRSDSSSVSSGGLTDNELDFIRGTAFKEQKESVDMDEGAGDGGEGVVEQFGRGGRRRVNVKRQYYTKNLRKQRRKRKRKVVNKMKKMDPDELGKYICAKLEEPKFHLIAKSIEVLGKEAVVALFLKTAKIERHGGLMIKNQERRRTAGGVFFYLLRGDRKFSKRSVDKIFAADNQMQRSGRKRVHKEKRLKKLARLEAMKTEHEEQANQGDDGSETVTTDQEAPVEVKKETKESSGSSAEDEDEEVDSDEFCGKLEPKLEPTEEYLPSTDMRNLVAYEDQDFLDIHCDPSDLI